MRRAHRMAKAKGRLYYVNKPEDLAAKAIISVGMTCSKRGYPDFTVYNKDGSIYGFIEVKPNDERQLKKEQESFFEFCASRKIPCLKWSPEDGPEKIVKFLKQQEFFDSIKTKELLPCAVNAATKS